ncbi:MAG: helix-turn-helix domain-containing protein [Nevskiales bacterium]
MSADDKRKIRSEVFVWDRRFFLRADPYFMDRRHNPYKRLSMTFIIGNSHAFEIGIDGGPMEICDAVLLAPNVSREYIASGPGGICIFDIGINRPAYPMLYQLLKEQISLYPNRDQLSALRKLVGDVNKPLDCESAQLLFEQVLDSLCESGPPPDEQDRRLARVLALIDELPQSELSSAVLAQQAHLSESRLRSLFKARLGCTLSQYIRWNSAWKAVMMLKQGASFTEIAHAVGFYDLAHADRVFNEIFGMNPTQITDPAATRLYFCE